MTGAAVEDLQASGNLDDTPFSHLVLFLYRQAESGTLAVRTSRGAEFLVQVRQGRPIAARSSEPGADLMHALLPACGERHGEFTFYASDRITAPDGPLSAAPLITGELDPYALLYASLHAHVRDDIVDGVLERYPSAQLSLAPDRDLGRLALEQADLAFVELLRRRPATIDALVARSPLPGQRTRRLLYALLVTHMLTPEAVRERDIYQSQVHPEPPPRQGPSEQATVQARPSQPAQQARSLSQGNSPPASRPQATPRTPSARPTPSIVNEVAAASMPAWQRLMSMRPPGARSSLGPKGPLSLQPPASANASLRPAIAIQDAVDSATNDLVARRRRIELLTQSARFAEALPLLDEAIADEGQDGKLHGLRARALFEVHKGDRGGLPRTVVETVRRAHELDPDEANAYFTKGLIFKQAGEVTKAIACWRRALATDPKHIDAQREIRLAHMRAK